MKFEDITKGTEVNDLYSGELDEDWDNVFIDDFDKGWLLRKNHVIWEFVKVDDGTTYIATNKYVDSFWAMGETPNVHTLVSESRDRVWTHCSTCNELLTHPKHMVGSIIKNFGCECPDRKTTEEKQ